MLNIYIFIIKYMYIENIKFGNNNLWWMYGFVVFVYDIILMQQNETCRFKQ